ncbi:dinitrogenase iron-molybdenum cofactor biosynthesis protein [Euryarchaeota archaeon ex4484_178]|nr:MAG: dinitrogenase iron-molybdenum cofactor biosynthesis protein [Euryarchaeota archaeon ex4484_178]
MIVAVSTSDGKRITNDHFGEGDKFLIYHVDFNGYRLIEERINTSPEEEEHGSAEKAKGISQILSDIPILLGYQFGPNIMRIKDKFLPIVSRERDIEKALYLMVRNYEEIKREEERERGNVIIMDGGKIKIIKVRDVNAKDF